MRPQKIQEKLNDLGKKYTSQFHSQFNLSNKMLLTKVDLGFYMKSSRCFV